ncbi:hypothetical protein PC118_g19169 [Phytophthora cactorum]|uniref:Uncharacterized protein n=1 Tax=Phytophthora cactorum TaxID=29920 RepID=A0A8T1F7X2_9STRA|nr:hypothetical protein PC111_g16256 [Phytophthora cactorum]KAG2966450.1 hypothetical protein PC118_g19169 [Phytophthora cactorum]
MNFEKEVDLPSSVNFVPLPVNQVLRPVEANPERVVEPMEADDGEQFNDAHDGSLTRVETNNDSSSSDWENGDDDSDFSDAMGYVESERLVTESEYTSLSTDEITGGVTAAAVVSDLLNSTSVREALASEHATDKKRAMDTEHH